MVAKEHFVSIEGEVFGSVADCNGAVKWSEARKQAISYLLEEQRRVKDKLTQLRKFKNRLCRLVGFTKNKYN